MRQFTHVLALLGAAGGGTGASASPLELLASGFLALAERRVSDAAASPRLVEPEDLTRVGGVGIAAGFVDIPLEAAPASPVAIATPAAPAPRLALPGAAAGDDDRAEAGPAARPGAAEPIPFTPVPRTYSAQDRDVTAPLAIEQKLPLWRPLSDGLRRQTFVGRVQIVIDVDGRVIDAEILQPSHPVYDDQLRRAVMQWRYTPATKRGFPVQYRRVVDYTLRPPAF